MGWFSDRSGRRNVILRSGSVIALVGLIFLVHFTPQSTFLLAALIFVMGAAGSAMTVCFGSVKELNDPDFSSTAIGFMNMCVVGAGAVMQPLIGWLLDLQWGGELIDGVPAYSASDFSFALSALLVANVMAVIAAFLLRETFCKQVNTG